MSTALQHLNKIVAIAGPAVAAFESPVQRPLSALSSVLRCLATYNKFQDAAGWDLSVEIPGKLQAVMLEAALKIASAWDNSLNMKYFSALMQFPVEGLHAIRTCLKGTWLKTASCVCRFLSNLCLFGSVDLGVLSLLGQRMVHFKQAAALGQIRLFSFQTAGFFFETTHHVKKLYSKWSTLTAEQKGYCALKIGAKSVLTYVAYTRFNLAYQEWQKIKDIVQHCFVLVRVPQHDEEDKLTAKGIKQVELVADKVSDVMEEIGVDAIEIVSSARGCAQEAGKLLNQEVGYNIDDFIPGASDDDCKFVGPDVGLNGNRSAQLLKQKGNESIRAQHQALDAQGKFTFEAPITECESGKACCERTMAVINQRLDAVNEKTLSIFVTHQENLLNIGRGLGLEELSSHHATSGEMYLLERTDGKYAVLDHYKPTAE